HSHADALSFELAADGQSFLLDPGTFTYTGSREMRDWFRGTSAHNTVTLDGESSSVPAGPFSWRHIANCKPLKWITTSRFDYVEGSHDGFTRFPDPAVHNRGVLFLKNDYWIVIDKVKARLSHFAECWYHFDSGVEAEVITDETISLINAQAS